MQTFTHSYLSVCYSGCQSFLAHFLSFKLHLFLDSKNKLLCEEGYQLRVMIEKPCQTTQAQGESRVIDPGMLKLQMSISQNVRLETRSTPAFTLSSVLNSISVPAQHWFLYILHFCLSGVSVCLFFKGPSVHFMFFNSCRVIAAHSCTLTPKRLCHTGVSKGLISCPV